MNTANRCCLSGSAPERYEAHLVPTVFGSFAEGLVQVADPQQGEHMIDAACGSKDLSEYQDDLDLVHADPDRHRPQVGGR
ncbi:MAG: hypothetical protein WAL83_00375 [Arenicellales bacterium]